MMTTTHRWAGATAITAAPDEYARVFDRGLLHERYRDRRPVRGAGIGLAPVHGLVTRMGRTITAGPAPEGGACFPVRLI